jgi:hypothetical protein
MENFRLTCRVPGCGWNKEIPPEDLNFIPTKVTIEGISCNVEKLLTGITTHELFSHHNKSREISEERRGHRLFGLETGVGRYDLEQYGVSICIQITHEEWNKQNTETQKRRY